MHRLVYKSQAVGEPSARDLADIACQSQANNKRFGVTGLLLIHDGSFFQELEGPRSAVSQAFARIRRDPRHEKIEVLEFGPARERAFASWRIGVGHPEDLPETARDFAFSLFDLIPRDAPERGARDRVRDKVRAYLAAFERLVPEGDRRH